MSVYKMLDEVKKALRPDPEVTVTRDEVLATINAELDKREIVANAVPGGSVAKGTFLHGDHDIDVFVRFALDYEDEELPDIVEDVLKRYKPERIHGSRDYFQFTHRGLDFEVVPVLAVDGAHHARNVTDMSPLHVEYFLSRGAALQDEVRLAKQFCKAARIYGAESYIRGFSGHVIDLLILHYESFYTLVKEAAGWKAPVIIDLEEHHDDALRAIDRQKHAPLIIVDPVQPDRNAAAALSEEQFLRFVERCKAFLREPSEAFFVIPSFDEDQLLSRLRGHAGAAVLVRLTHPAEDKKDVAGGRVRKAFERLKAGYERNGFSLVETGWHFAFGASSILWFVTDEHSLPRLAHRRGPPVGAGVDAERFRKTHDEVWEEDGVLWTKAERAVQRPEQVPAMMRDHLTQHLRVGVEAIERLE